ncbi:glycosyltransferase 87 family protein [Ornithinimicrobium sp. Arc0846-15]|nr:glycosyltransferase 87 family protein [Ornithinimicrobium laminariae]
MSSTAPSKGGGSASAQPPPFDVPSHSDPVVAMASNVIGGPLGRYAVVGRDGLGAIMAALMVMASVVMALGVFQKGHCLMKGWVSPDQFWRACYSDVTVVNISSSLANRDFPYAGETPVDQPLLSGLAMWVLSWLSPFSGAGIAAQRSLFVMWALVCLILLAAGIVAVVAMQPSRPWQAAHLAASPVLVFLALISVDLLGVILVIYGLWAWQRRHPVLAGAFLGVAFLMRPYPLVFLLAIVLVSIPARRVNDALQAALASVLAAVTIYLPMLVLYDNAVLASPRGWLTAGPGYGSLMLVVESAGVPISSGTATGISLLGWLVAAGVGYRLATTRSHPSILTIAAPMMLIVALTAQSVSAQTGLWLLPFVALSAVSWRDHLIWAATEIIHFEAVWLRIADASDPGRGLDPGGYGIFVVIRFIGWGWLLWQVTRPRPAQSGRGFAQRQDALASSPTGL